MFNIFIKKWKDRKKRKKLRQLKEELKISFNGYLVINGLVVNEFNYLFQYILKNAGLDSNMLLNKTSFAFIEEHKKEILRAITIELVQDELREQKAHNITYNEAVYNMRNLELIINRIITYEKESKKISNSFNQ